MDSSISNLMVLKIIENIRRECTASISITAEAAKRFFKTSEGSYGAADQFLGITVPDLRKIAKKYKEVALQVIEELLQSPYNEERLLALLIVVHQYEKGTPDRQEELSTFYLSNLDRINNWNLVDSSAYQILGHYLWNRDRSILAKLATSHIFWERRIAIVTTRYFICKFDLESTFDIAKLLLNDQEELIHKAVGWMLREAGKRDEARLISFLSDHADQMAKTMLRYATERLSQEQKEGIRAKS